VAVMATAPPLQIVTPPKNLIEKIGLEILQFGGVRAN